MYGHPSPMEESGSQSNQTDDDDVGAIDTPRDSGNDISITTSFDDFRSSDMAGERPIPQPRRHLEKPINEEKKATEILRRITTIKD